MFSRRRRVPCPYAAIMGGRDKPGHDDLQYDGLGWVMGELIHSRTAVYMMASRKHGTIYIGVTGEFIRRIVQHREGLKPGFTERYGVKRLVWFEMHEGIATAIQREKSLKRYPRQWKINLIEEDNPHWDDLFDGLMAEPPNPDFKI
jgi:putative endonuclease